MLTLLVSSRLLFSEGKIEFRKKSFATAGRFQKFIMLRFDMHMFWNVEKNRHSDKTFTSLSLSLSFLSLSLSLSLSLFLSLSLSLSLLSLVPPTPLFVCLSLFPLSLSLSLSLSPLSRPSHLSGSKACFIVSPMYWLLELP